MSISRGSLVLRIDNIYKFPPFVLLWKAIMSQHCAIQFTLYYLSVAAYGRSKTKENFKLLALKAVAVAYKRLQIK